MNVDYGYDPTNEITIESNLFIPMRDSTLLKGLMYSPKEEGRYPVLVERVPYELAERCKPYAEYYSSRGYVFVGQTTRGLFGSGGDLESFGRSDGWGVNRDGYDTIEWIASQPWCDGNIGMLDGSASGATQYLVAPTRPPHLKALFVRMGGSGTGRGLFRNGAYNLGLALPGGIGLMISRLSHPTAPSGSDALLRRYQQAQQEIDSWYRYLPLKSMPLFKGIADWFLETMYHFEEDSHWSDQRLSLHYGEVDVPILHLSGWYDHRLESTVTSFQGIRQNGESEHCRSNQRLIIGPWFHAPTAPYERQVGEIDFGEQAAIDLNTFRLGWYDYWLKGTRNGAMESAPVRLFLMGDNRWVNLDTWPPPGVDYRPMYLHEGSGRSAESLNNGGLAFGKPEDAERPDSYVYDPDDPVPSVALGLHAGVKDHSPVEGRMLTYTTDVLEKDLTMMGPVKATIYGLSSALDTDWVVRLCDVWPDGRSMNVCDGILRTRYRNSFDKPELMHPGQVCKCEVDMCYTAQTCKAGHRIRVQVTSSDFPRYDRNLNTGGLFGEETRGQAAVNTVIHDATRPSHILLPVVSGRI